MTILLNDILGFTEDELKNTKLRFNKKSSNDNFDPVKLYKENRNELYKGQFWNYSKTKSFLEGQIAIGLFRISNDKWLLFDISRITKDLNNYNGVGYEYETLEEYSKYFGRLIVSYRNRVQNLIRNAQSVIHQCQVDEIISSTFDDDLFPGYENMNLSWSDLKRVIDKTAWRTALENQKGVYLITDVSNGKRYVGSASGEHMLHGRFKSYVHSGHGDNKDLKKLSFEHIKKNFRYSILEIYKSTTSTEVILNREHQWMKILLSKNKNYGYNN